MHPWERRLKDLSQLLVNCESTYFEPELFRINTNQFLQTSRTVTFIIQKNKDSIPDFDKWYEENVLQPWSADQVMTWAKDSRNQVEKVGDLELFSSLDLRLIFSYIEDDDIVLEVGRDELVAANVKRLIRFAQKNLPSGVSDAAIVKIERRWVANTLSDWELLTALTYIYARSREVCESLASKIGAQLSPRIPDATQFDTLHSDAKATRYVKLREPDNLGRIRSQRYKRDPDFNPPPALVLLKETSASEFKSKSLEGLTKAYTKFAKITFEHYGNHVPMLMMFDRHWKQIDFVSTHFDDQAEKYIFWRSIADRVLYLNPQALIWICESWIRDLRPAPYKAIRNMPIKGEQLSVTGLDRNGNIIFRSWNIRRDRPDSQPILEDLSAEEMASPIPEPLYLTPVVKAFEQLRTTE